jgi:hypothetical protein
MTQQEKATKLYSDAYNRCCYELSHDKNVLTAKNICEYICNEVLSAIGFNPNDEYWVEVKNIIKKSNHNELYNK